MRRAGQALVVVVFLVATAFNAFAQARTIRMPTSSGSERIFAILLPLSYETSKARYPVVYLFHGGGQDHTAFMARTAFPPMAGKHDFIVVMPAADRSYSALGPEAQRLVLPGGDAGPYAVTVDGSGIVWVNEIETDTVVRFDPRTETMRVVALPSSNVGIRKMAIDQRGRLWYMGSHNGRLGVVE